MSSPASPQEEPQDHSNLEAIRAIRLEKVEQLKALGQNPYAYRWESTHHSAELQEKFADLPTGEEVDIEVAIAGRILARRVFGNWRSSISKMKRAQFNSIWTKSELQKRWQMCQMPLTISNN
jgi:lysyl-tRNA synthetase class II